MELKVLEMDKTRARILFRGEDHTFMNLLTDEILKDPDVEVAQYTMEFQFSDPELLVVTNAALDPIRAIKEACARIARSCDELTESLSS